MLDKICESLDILEKDYFGLTYADKRDPRVWLELDKRVGKFMKSEFPFALLESLYVLTPVASVAGEPWKLSFEVKFYPPDPAGLQEDLTRYQLCLQIRNDILAGRLPCTFVTYGLLGSYLVSLTIYIIETRRKLKCSGYLSK